MAFSFVHDTQTSGTSLSSITITIPSVAQGNLLVVSLKTTVAITGISVTDNASVPNTYASAVNAESGTNNMHLLYGVAVTGGATSVTASWTGVGNVRITVDEYSGGMQTNATVFDVANSGTGLAVTSSSVSLTPTNNGELIVGALSTSAGSSIVAGSGYTLANNNSSNATEYKLSGTTSESVAYSWTTSSAYAQCAAAFIAAPVPSNGNFMAFT